MATSVPVVGLLGESESPWKGKAQQLVVPVCAALAVVAFAWRAAEWACLRPRRLERALRAQGLRGTAYRPLAGDAALSERLAREARSAPPLPPGSAGRHGIVPRAMPLVPSTTPSKSTVTSSSLSALAVIIALTVTIDLRFHS